MDGEIVGKWKDIHRSIIIGKVGMETHPTYVTGSGKTNHLQ